MQASASLEKQWLLGKPKGSLPVPNNWRPSRQQSQAVPTGA